MTSSPKFDFNGQVCVVTGAGSGIGREVALAFGEAGASVAVLDRNEAGTAETVSAIEAAGGIALAVEVDTGNPDSIRAACDRVTAAFGEASVLVNNAGTLGSVELEDVTLEEWNQVMAVNCTGYLLCAQAFGRPMLSRGSGSIVNVTSLAAEVTTGHVGAYGVSKAAATMLSNILALEWGPRGVRSNAVLPGFIRTPISAATYADPEATRRRAAAIPVGRIGDPADVADAVLFLANPTASYLNGAEIVVDGAFRHAGMERLRRSK